MKQDIIDTVNIIITGVGGQGVLFAGRQLADIAMHEGFDVKTSEIHGMSQQGGSVIMHVRFGKQVFSPVIESGQADLMLALEELEALRYADYMKAQGVILLSECQIKPLLHKEKDELYPKDIAKRLRERYTVCPVSLDSGKIQNMVMLGAAVHYLGFSKQNALKIIETGVSKKNADLNREAFLKGYEMAERKAWLSKQEGIEQNA